MYITLLAEPSYVCHKNNMLKESPRIQYINGCQSKQIGSRTKKNFISLILNHVSAELALLIYRENAMNGMWHQFENQMNMVGFFFSSLLHKSLAICSIKHTIFLGNDRFNNGLMNWKISSLKIHHWTELNNIRSFQIFLSSLLDWALPTFHFKFSVNFWHFIVSNVQITNASKITSKPQTFLFNIISLMPNCISLILQMHVFFLGFLFYFIFTDCQITQSFNLFPSYAEINREKQRSEFTIE